MGEPVTAAPGRYRTASLAIGIAVALLGLTIGVPSSASAGRAPAPAGYRTVTVSGPDPAAHGRWGERTAVAGDIDHDGDNDLFVGQPSEPIGGQPRVGRVYLLSGKELANGKAKVLYVINSPEPQAGAAFGFALTVIGDVNGDGVPDVAIGTDAQDVGSHPQQGEAWVFSGATGALLYALNNPAPQGSANVGSNPGHRARFGSRIARAGDINGDGVPDVLVGASGNDVPAGCSEITPIPADCRVAQGQAFIFDGRNGTLLRTLNLPVEDQVPEGGCQAECGQFGLSVQGPGDVDGDGVPDQVVSAPTYKGIGRMYVFDGRTGALLRRIDDPVPQHGALFGFEDVAPLAPGDVNGDGRADIYGNGFLQNVRPTGTGEGEAWVFDGKTGAVLYNLRAPDPQDGGQFGFSLTTTNYNGHPSLYVGSTPHHVPGAIGSGGTFIFNARNGAFQRAFELPPSDVQPATPQDLGPALGWTVSAPGDLNGDGRPDYVAGAPFTDRGANQDEGLLYVFVSDRSVSPATGRPGGHGTPWLAIIVPVVVVVGTFVVALVVRRRRRRRRRRVASTAEEAGSVR